MNTRNNINVFFSHKSTIWMPFFLGLVLIATVLIYLNFPLAYNQGIYHYQGFVLKNGGLPYIDFIEKKGPMGLFIYSLASILFGETAIDYRIFDLLLLSTIGLFLFRLVRLEYSKPTGWFVCVIWIQHVLIDGPGNTGDVTNIITAAYVALAYCLLAPNFKNRSLVAGILIALACWVKPTALFIAVPLLYLCLKKSKNSIYTLNRKVILKFFLGLGIPSIIFIIYLVGSDSLSDFWEVVVLDTVYNYSGKVSRFGFRVLSKTGWTFLKDPVFRIGGLLGLFLFSKKILLKLLVVGIGLMLFIEGRFYPYQFSILWPFLALGIFEGFLFLSHLFSIKKQGILLILFCTVMTFPLLKTGYTFIKAGFLTTNFKVEELFIIPDFKTMYTYRSLVVSYLKEQIQEQDEVIVLGHDPNIYLELGAITNCRLARDGGLLTEEPNQKTPSHLIKWQQELLYYLQSEKADWIIVLKMFPHQWKWAPSYKELINKTLKTKYKLNHSTEGHLIYKKLK